MSTPVSAAGVSGLLREACADLVRRLRNGESAAAEQYFTTFPALADDPDAAVELIYSEFALLDELGRAPDEATFLTRFPRWQAKLRRQFDIHRLLNGATEDEAQPTTGSAGAATGPARTVATDAPAERFGAYEIVRPLGRGGMGTVYLAIHGELGRLAALKILNTPAIGDPRSVERFRSEVRSAAALGHPGIVQLYELGESSAGRQFAAFEYVEGGTLRAALGGRPRAPFEAVDLVRRLAEAVACAHRAGIVHCDLTPANIFLTRDGDPKIGDFGLARLPRTAVDLSSPELESTDASIRSDVAPGDEVAESDGGSSFVLAGTPGYLAPERIEHPEVATPEVDVYGLGAVLYELLTGRAPHVGSSPWETLRQAKEFDPPSPRQLVPGIPRDAATICLKCLAREPARRYADAAALAADLQRFRSGEPIAARPVGVVERGWKWARRRPGSAVALVSTCAALATLLVGGAWYNVRLRSALDRTVTQQRQIDAQRDELQQRLERQRRDLFTLQLNQAEALLERAPHQSRALLEDRTHCPIELRDFAWGLLLRRASQERRTFLGHAAPVLAATTASDGRLVTAAADDRVRLWDVRSGTTTNEWTVDTSEAAHVVLSPDGRRLAAAGPDGSLAIWSLQTPEAVERRLVGHAGRIAALAFFPDGKWLASAGEEGDVAVWDPSGALVASIPTAEAGEILSLAAAPDGLHVAVGLVGRRLKVIDVVSGAVRREWNDAGSAAVQYFADGRSLLSSDLVDGRISVWNVADGKLRKSVDAPGVVLRTIAVDRAGRRLAHADADQTLRVVEIESGQTIAEYRGHADRIGALAFVDAGAAIVSASDDHTVKLWDVPGRRLFEVVEADESKTLTAAIDHAGARLAAAGYDTTIRLTAIPQDARTAEVPPDDEVQTLAGHSGAVYAVRFLPDDRRLLSCGEDGSLRLWNLTTGRTIRTWEHPDWVLDVVVDRAGRRCWTACADGKIREFAWDEVRPRREFPAHDEAVTCLALDEDRHGKVVLVSGSRDGRVCVWNETGDLVAATAALGGVTTVATFDGTIAAGNEDGIVTVWRPSGAEPPRVLRGHARGVYAVAFSPDGKNLATASGGRWIQTTGEVKLWDVATGQVHATLPGLTAPLVFRGDGRMLAAADEPKRRIVLWEAAPYAEARRP